MAARLEPTPPREPVLPRFRLGSGGARLEPQPLPERWQRRQLWDDAQAASDRARDRASGALACGGRRVGRVRVRGRGGAERQVPAGRGVLLRAHRQQPRGRGPLHPRREQRGEPARRAVSVYARRQDGPSGDRGHDPRRDAVREQPVVPRDAVLRLEAQDRRLLRRRKAAAALGALSARGVQLYRRMRARQPRPVHHVVRLDPVRAGGDAQSRRGLDRRRRRRDVARPARRGRGGALARGARRVCASRGGC
mmetsp:Transcript_31184/g.99741  ORF Transcript_31184/g.99741 Transcript_31184/m.99741 type:complete len:251 (+) Transcript_31184:261-1013(+)